MSDEQEPEAIGWNAIDAALSEVYGDVEPKHWGTIIPYMLGGPDPLTGLSAYQDNEDGKVWHFVTYGFSDLYEKEGEDPEVSGYGFELTFRLVADDVEEHASWVFNFLQNLARYVFETGCTFGPGHTMPLNGPIRQESETKITDIAFVLDPQLGRINTGNGSVEFLQIVGLTQEEMAAIDDWNAQSFLDLVAETNPLLVTDLERKSYLANRKFAEKVANRTKEEGASSGIFHTDEFRFKVSLFTRNCKLKLSAYLIDDLTRRISGRIPYGREFILSSESAAVMFVRADKNAWSVEGDTLKLELTSDTVLQLAETSLPNAGSYQIPGLDRFVIEVERTEIKDNEGKVTKVVG